MSTPPFLRLPPGVTRCRVGAAGVELAGLEARPGTAAPGVPVLLLPGFTGSKEDFLAVLAPLAAEGYRVVAVDQRGQYESPRDQPRERYTVAALAADAVAAARGLDAGPVHLLGHSFGGLVARAAAVADPSAFRSVTLLGSGPAALPPPRAESLRQLLEALPRLDAEHIWGVMRELDLEAGVVRPADVDAFLRARFVANDPVGLVVAGEALLAETDQCPQLRDTGLPLHVCYGEDDDSWPPAVQADMAARLDAAHTIVPGSAHSPAAEAPEPTAKALAAFWARVDDAR